MSLDAEYRPGTTLLHGGIIKKINHRHATVDGRKASRQVHVALATYRRALKPGSWLSSLSQGGGLLPTVNRPGAMIWQSTHSTCRSYRGARAAVSLLPPPTVQEPSSATSGKIGFMTTRASNGSSIAKSCCRPTHPHGSSGSTARRCGTKWTPPRSGRTHRRPASCGSISRASYREKRVSRSCASS